jgi:predicted negative regulator of RcsB-dependent stress response
MADINKILSENKPTAAIYVLRGKIRLAQYETERAYADFKKAEEMGYDKTVIDDLIRMTKNK